MSILAQGEVEEILIQVGKSLDGKTIWTELFDVDEMKESLTLFGHPSKAAKVLREVADWLDAVPVGRD